MHCVEKGKVWMDLTGTRTPARSQSLHGLYSPGSCIKACVKMNVKAVDML
jgi:hypothetical protein